MSKRLLIVDDSRAMRMIIRKTLRQAGLGHLDVEEAEDGQKGLDAIRYQPPDLVLCDWNMPNMTGIELLRTLKSEGIHVKFGFVTTESSLETRQAAAQAGALFLIAKPFTAEHLRKAIGPLIQ